MNEPSEPEAHELDRRELAALGDASGSVLPVLASTASLAFVGSVTVVCSVFTLCGATLAPWLAVVGVATLAASVSAGLFARARRRERGATKHE